jgi:hypothetical protein
MTLLIRNDLGGRASILVQCRMRSLQDRVVDPIESQRFQARIDAAAQAVVREQRPSHAGLQRPLRRGTT